MFYCSQPTPAKLIANGPYGIGMRNYFGSDIIELFGRDILQNAPAVVSELKWGGLRIDLADKPWKADPEKLLNNWTKIMNKLEPPHLFSKPDFDDKESIIRFSPNTAWEKYLRSQN